MWDPTTVPFLTQCYVVGFPRLFKKGWVPHFRKHCLKPGWSRMGRGRCWRLWASRGMFSMLWVEKVPAGAQSVLTCVTWASAVWLVDWMNIVWVSSCPAGIVTGWIWYNCCKIKRQRRRKFRIWTNVGWWAGGLLQYPGVTTQIETRLLMLTCPSVNWLNCCCPCCTSVCVI